MATCSSVLMFLSPSSLLLCIPPSPSPPLPLPSSPPPIVLFQEASRGRSGVLMRGRRGLEEWGMRGGTCSVSICQLEEVGRRRRKGYASLERGRRWRPALKRRWVANRMWGNCCRERRGERRCRDRRRTWNEKSLCANWFENIFC